MVCNINKNINDSKTVLNDQNDYNYMIQVIKDGILDKAKSWIERGGNVNLKSTNESLIHLVIQYKRMDFVELFLSKNVDLSVKDKNGLVALNGILLLMLTKCNCAK